MRPKQKRQLSNTVVAPTTDHSASVLFSKGLNVIGQHLQRLGRMRSYTLNGRGQAVQAGIVHPSLLSFAGLGHRKSGHQNTGHLAVLHYSKMATEDILDQDPYK